MVRAWHAVLGARVHRYAPAIAAPICRRCGAAAPDHVDGDADVVPLGWSSVHEGARVDLLCERCTRDNVRSIEGKLDEEWW